MAAQRVSQGAELPVVPHAAVAEPTRISSVLGEERDGLGRHTFLGGNFFMLRMLNRYRGELGVEALPQELDAAAHATIRQLQQDTATVSDRARRRCRRPARRGGSVQNLTGHKLPTGYPSRRAWLHVIRPRSPGRVVFSPAKSCPPVSFAATTTMRTPNGSSRITTRFAARTKSRSTNP